MKFILLMSLFCRLTLALPSQIQTVYSHSSSSTANKIGTYVSSGNGFYTSSYWIEGKTKLIIIDTQFLLSAAEELIQIAESTTGKKVGLAIVLHPNPDKFNGAQVFKKKGIRVITSEQVAAKIPAVHALRKEWFYETFKPDYPETAPQIEVFGNKPQDFTFDGIDLKLITLGKGCSDAHLVVKYEEHLFPGDLVTQGFHSWLELGYLEEWLKRISEIKQLGASEIHPGRGPSGGKELLDNQEQYLSMVAKLFRPFKRKPTEKDLASLEAKILSAYPSYRYPLFVEHGLVKIWKP